MMHDPYRPSRTPQPGIATYSLPPCPTCGGLNCLCRPRFFAGQLITEDDLNRLEGYIVKKNQLHNRYLHRWGVVCGLEVVCHPYDEYLTVRTGYALSPCGDDIIVCQDTTVNVGDLIRQCRYVEPRYPECVPPRPESDPNCREVIEEWVLAICYEERSSRGITALRGSSGSVRSSHCTCGGSSSCGCASHSQSHAQAGSGQHNGQSRRPVQRPTTAQCEPTQICEGYSWNVYKAPVRHAAMPRPDALSTIFGREYFQLPGEMGRRFDACNALFEARWSKLPAGASIQELHAWCCDTKEALLDFFTQHAVYDCTLYDRLARIACPDPTGFDAAADYAAVLGPVVAQVTSVGAEYLRYCLCAALLPPCPEPTMSNCVPLAMIQVRKADYKILQVCNWGPRRLVVTFPSLGYWLNASDVLRNLHRSLEQLCCAPLRQKSVRVPDQPPLMEARPADPSRAGSTPTSGPSRTAFSTLFSESWRNRRRTVDAQTLLLGAVGATDERNQPFASDLEIAHSTGFSGRPVGLIR